MNESDMTPAQAGALAEDEFVRRFGGAYEHSPWVAEQAWRRRPFHDFDGLARAFETAVLEAPVQRQLALVRSHPELAGPDAEPGTLTAESISEQASAGLHRLSVEEAARLRSLNNAYREKFGFPMVIAVREHTKASIFAQAQARLENAREAELRTALGQIAQIARLRLLELVTDNDRERETT